MEEKKIKVNKIQSKEVMYQKIKSIRNYLKTIKRQREDILNANENIINDYNHDNDNDYINNDIKDDFVIIEDNNDIEYDRECIYIKYLENPNIIFQNKGDIHNLKLMFNELKKDIEDGYNILFPFIDICPNLIKAYIESDIDDINFENEIIPLLSESTYIKTIIELKNNFFINKEVLFPIMKMILNLKN